MTIRVNLGVVFDALIILIVGIFLLGFGLILGLFSAILALSFAAPLAFSIAGLVLILAGIVDMLSGVRGWTRWNKREGPQLVQQRIQRRIRNEETLNAGQRFGEIVSAIIIVAIFAFYVYHQVANTGFFTSSFGPWEMFAFYGSMLLMLVPPIARAVIGKRNPVRPVEVAVNLFFAGASLFLLSLFPFNMAHFSDALPMAVRFMVSWATNDIARIILVLMFIGGLISSGVNIARYLTFRPIESSDWERRHSHLIAE